MIRTILVSLALPLLLAATPATRPPSTGTGTAPTPVAPTIVRAPADFSTPRAAAKSYLTAMKNMDEAAVRGALSISPTHKASVDALLATTTSMWELQNAVVKRFGKEGEKVFGTNTNADVLAARFKSIDAAELKEAGDTVTLAIPEDTATSQSASTIVLRKDGTNWKLDAASLFGLDRTAADKLQANLALSKKLVEITKQLTKEIDAGDYLAANDAYKVYWQRSTDAARPLNPTTTPATQKAPT